MALIFFPFSEKMETFRETSSRVVNEVMSHLDILEGTQYSEVMNDVRIALVNGLRDLREIVVENKEEIKINPKAAVGTLQIEGRKYRVCHMASQTGGIGLNAVGGIGVAWAEQAAFNMSMKICTNVVNKRNGELWGIVVAAKTGIARKFDKIIIATDDYTYTKRVMKDLKEGKFDEKDECKMLVERIREAEKKIEIRIPDEIEAGIIASTGDKVKKVSIKLAKDACVEAKKEMGHAK